jgi:hypothetical protein
MPSFTPQAIVDELYQSDLDLEECATQFAWFKGQRDWWKNEYELEFAKAKVRAPSKYGANEHALVSVSERMVEIPWMPGNFITLPEMVRLTDASFDLVSKRYNQLETHIGILQSVNKNIMQDYARAGANEWAH